MSEQDKKNPSGDNVIPIPTGKNVEEVIGKHPDLARKIDECPSVPKKKIKKPRAIPREKYLLSCLTQLAWETRTSYSNISFPSDVRTLIEDFLKCRTLSPRQFRDKDLRREFVWGVLMVGMALERIVERDYCSCPNCAVNCPASGEQIK